MYEVEMEKESAIVQRDKKEILNSIERSLSGQSNLFSGESLVVLFSKYLEKCGYIVVKPPIDNEIATIPALVSLFYSLLEYKYRKKYYGDTKLNLKLASFFVEDVMDKFSCSKEASIKICASIIRTVVVYESYFCFKNKLTDFSVFNKVNLGWLIKKAFDIMDSPTHFQEDITEDQEVKWKEFIDEYVDMYGEGSLGFDL